MVKFKKTTCVFSLFLILFLLLPSFSEAQTIPPRPTAGMGMRQWRGENRCWKAADLNLSPDQVKGLDLISQAYLKETRPLRNELFSKRLEFREFLTDPNIKAELIQLKNTEVLALESKIGDREVDYLIKVKSLLTLEQLKNWCPEQEFPFLRGMMQRPETMGSMPPRKTPPHERSREE